MSRDATATGATLPFPESRRHHQSLFAGLGIALLAATGALGAYFLHERSPIVATVGPHAITERDLTLRNQVNRIYNPRVNSTASLSQLTRAFTSIELLRSLGAPITDSMLDAEEKRVDANSLWPERLAQIKQVFNGDHNAYRRIVLLPNLAERILEQKFRSDRQLQAKSLGDATTFLEALPHLQTDKTPSKDSFAELAARYGKTVARLHVIQGSGIHFGAKPDSDEPPALALRRGANPSEAEVVGRMVAKTQQSNGETAQRWIQEIVPQLKPGEVFSRIVDYNDQWLIVRYTGVLGSGHHTFDGVTFAKDDFSAWYEKEKTKVSVVLKKG